jgi:hypothetical protein
VIKLLVLLVWFLAHASSAQAQVNVIGAVTPGHCAIFFSQTQIQDGVAAGCGLGGTLGSMAFQNANNVAITGGFVTGMPTPTAAADVATKQYVDNAAVGFNPHAASTLATTAALPANTYNNGASGVGATLTANANGALSVDSTAVVVGNRIVVKNETTAANNGIYAVTQTGSGAAPYILTRATDANQPGTNNPNLIGFGTFTFVGSGTTNLNSGWQVNSVVTAIGTSAINWVQFSGGTVAVTQQVNTAVANGGLVTSGNCNNTNTNLASPCAYSLTAGRLTLPTTSVVTLTTHSGGFGANGSGTYTTPANVLWIDIMIVGGGGGGGGGNNSTPASNGNSSCWNTTGAACTTPVYSAGGGGGSAHVTTGAGGTVSGSGTCLQALAGASGSNGFLSGSGTAAGGGPGGATILGGNGGGAYGAVGFNAAANSGSGGGGGGVNGTTLLAGAGGGAGAACRVIITSPAATYTYAVGSGASGAAGGSGGFAGGLGSAGIITVIEHYGS